MNTILHITGGDCSGGSLAKSGLPGEVFVWHDILYEGPRRPGWPDEEILQARARFLEQETGGGLSNQLILETLRTQYAKLKSLGKYDRVILWFDACLFDQSMLCHILACMRFLGMETADLLCVDAFPGIEPYHGLGQLTPDQLVSVYDHRQSLTKEQFLFAEVVDCAFALQDKVAFNELATAGDAPLPWVPAAVARWLKEQPDSLTGLGLLEDLALEAICSGCETPFEIFSYASLKDTPPLFWGDNTLWAKINGLANREPPLVRIEGPTALLPHQSLAAVQTGLPKP